MAQRVFDPSPAVRRRHVEVLGAWCLALPDRCEHIAASRYTASIESLLPETCCFSFREKYLQKATLISLFRKKSNCCLAAFQKYLDMSN